MAEDLTRYANDPVGFVTDVLGDAGAPYSKQAEMLEALVDHRRVSVVGANGSGKDWTAGRAVLWWLETHPEAKSLVMGPTQRQVEEIVWPEMRAAHAAAVDALSGRMFKSAYRIDERRFALGFSTNNALNIQGFHSSNLLVVVTEAHAMPQAHMDAIKRLQPNRLLLVGNALSRDGEFYDSHHAKRGLYRRLAISAFDTPNFTGENGGNPGMITPQDVEEFALDYGEDHPLYAASVLAEFPDTLDDSLIGRDAVESAMERGEALHLSLEGRSRHNVAGEGGPADVDCHSERSAAEPRNLSGARPALNEGPPRDVSTSPPAPLNMTKEEIPAPLNMTRESDCHSERSTAEPRNLSRVGPAVDGRSPRDVSTSLNMTSEGAAASLSMTTLSSNEPVYMGVDVARFGFDKSVLCARQGQRVLAEHSLGRIDTMRLVYEVLMTADEMGVTAIFVDEGGVGGGVVDRLRELGAPVYGVHFGGAAQRPTRFFNRRSEIFWELRRLFDLQSITLPRDEELAGQLLALRYDVSSSGQVRLEGKREMRKRGMPSPDKADALALAFLVPPSFGIWTGAEPFLRDDTPPPPAGGEHSPYIAAYGYGHPPPYSEPASASDDAPDSGSVPNDGDRPPPAPHANSLSIWM